MREREQRVGIATPKPIENPYQTYYVREARVVAWVYEKDEPHSIPMGMLRERANDGLLDFVPNNALKGKEWWSGQGFDSREDAHKWLNAQVKNYSFVAKAKISFGRERLGFKEMTADEILSLNHYSRVKSIEMELYHVYQQYTQGKISRERFDKERRQWNTLWEHAKNMLPPDTNADVENMEAVLELATAAK